MIAEHVLRRRLELAVWQRLKSMGVPLVPGGFDDKKHALSDPGRYGFEVAGETALYFRELEVADIVDAVVEELGYLRV